MTTSFELRFPIGEIDCWSERYLEDDTGVLEIVSSVKERGFLTKPEFLRVCRWKTPRSQSRCASNSEDFIREVTNCAFSSQDERLKIEVLTLLTGVSWPTASVILHFFHCEAYPILDFRALWSLQTAVPPQYNFRFWQEYVEFSRRLARDSNVSVRNLDRALWQFSKTNQV